MARDRVASAAQRDEQVVLAAEAHRLHTATGSKDDRFDAYVLADVLRTDGHRLVSLTPDSPQTLALRSVVRVRTDLVEVRVAICNQLRAHLRVVFPAVVGLFADLDSPISLAFLTRFPTVEKAAWLSHKRLGAWLAANGYCGRTPLACCSTGSRPVPSSCAARRPPQPRTPPSPTSKP